VVSRSSSALRNKKLVWRDDCLWPFANQRDSDKQASETLHTPDDSNIAAVQKARFRAAGNLLLLLDRILPTEATQKVLAPRPLFSSAARSHGVYKMYRQTSGTDNQFAEVDFFCVLNDGATAGDHHGL
jgi:hypothetical protein